MKPILKNTVPETLTTYSSEHPNSKWEELRNHDEGSIYDPIRKQVVNDQFGLCAYCECSISEPSPAQVEHFHSKSDDSNPLMNWTLIWENMIGVCNGGSNRYAANYLSPLLSN